MFNSQYDKDIAEAVRVMRAGGVILYPTDTVWGIGCDATNAEAVAKVYAIKKRAESKAMICLVDSDNRIQRYVRNVPEVAWDVMTMSEKPTTVILDGADGLAKNLIAEDGSRMQKPIVSTSANISGQPAAQNYCDISEEIRNAVDYICTSRRQEHQPHKPSSIIRIRQNGEFEIIR